MSNTNYTNFSKKEEVVKPVPMPYIENPEPDEPVETIEVNLAPQNGVEKTKGIVNVPRLNVRKDASRNHKAIEVLKAGATVIIDQEASTEDFYKVTTASGVEGFCMKEFIDINN